MVIHQRRSIRSTGPLLLPLMALFLAEPSALAEEVPAPAPEAGSGGPQTKPPEGVEAPSDYQRRLEKLDQAGGEETEVDAEKTQAEVIEEKGAKAAKLSPAEAQRIEEIVVHARRREELLEETPVSVTALSQETLEEAGITRLDQIQRLVPNLTIFRTLTGQTGSIVIRGVGNFPFIYYDQGVGLYVDGVYLSRNSGSVLDIIDTAGIEVLRGPQGTLFGKNTVGGAVNIYTVKPKPELESYAQIRAGSFNTIETRAMLNLPVNIGAVKDKLFTRFSFASYNNSGYTHNILQDNDWSTRNSVNFLGAIRYMPRDDMTFDLTGTWSTSHTRPPGGQCRPVAFPAGTAPVTVTLDLFQPAVPGGYAQYVEECSKSEPYRFQADADGIAALESYGLWGIGEWDLGDAGWIEDLAVRGTGAWREQISRTRLDVDMTQFPVARQENVGGDSPLNGNPTFQQQVQAELQVNGNAWEDRIKMVGGVFGFWESADENLAFIFFPGNALAAPTGTSYNMTTTDNWDWAIFGQATAELTSWASLTAGVRYTQEKKGMFHRVEQPLNPTTPIAVEFNNSAIFDAWTPMASIAFPVPEDWLAPLWIDYTMGYFTYSRGFRGGGFNGGARTMEPEDIEPFLPEFINSFEIGTKSVALDQRLTLNLSFFLMDRTDQQVPQIVASDCPPENPTCVPPTRVLTRNAAASTSKGFEIEVNANPYEGLLIDASCGYTDSRFDIFPGAENLITGAPIDRSGQRVAFTPLWNTHLGIQYSVEVPVPGSNWLSGWLTPRIDWSFRSDTVNWAPEVTELIQPAYSLLNARLSYAFNDDRTQVAFWATNLAGVEYFIETVALPRITGVVTRYFEAPRAFGIEISQSY